MKRRATFRISATPQRHPAATTASITKFVPEPVFARRRQRVADKRIIARFHATDPFVDCGALDVLLVAESRTAAVQLAKSLGLRGIHLRTNPLPPTAQEVASLLASGQETLWRRFGDDHAPWQAIDTLPTRQ